MSAYERARIDGIVGEEVLCSELVLDLSCTGSDSDVLIICLLFTPYSPSCCPVTHGSQPFAEAFHQRVWHQGKASLQLHLLKVPVEASASVLSKECNHGRFSHDRRGHRRLQKVDERRQRIGDEVFGCVRRDLERFISFTRRVSTPSFE